MYTVALWQIVFVINWSKNTLYLLSVWFLYRCVTWLKAGCFYLTKVHKMGLVSIDWLIPVSTQLLLVGKEMHANHLFKIIVALIIVLKIYNICKAWCRQPYLLRPFLTGCSLSGLFYMRAWLQETKRWRTEVDVRKRTDCLKALSASLERNPLLASWITQFKTKKKSDSW